LVRPLWDGLEAHRALASRRTVAQGDRTGAQDVLEEHREILAALERDDPTAAPAVLSAHRTGGPADFHPPPCAEWFGGESGQTPLEYLQASRVARARHLLESTDKTVARIATDVGYADASTFSEVDPCGPPGRRLDPRGSS
jgi:AraC-like DNA-binding protein